MFDLRKIGFRKNEGRRPDCKAVFDEKRMGEWNSDTLSSNRRNNQEGTIYIPRILLGGDEEITQVIVFTGRNLFAKYKLEFTNLLNGFVVLRK